MTTAQNQDKSSPVSALLSERRRWWVHALVWLTFYALTVFIVSDVRGMEEALARSLINFSILLVLYYVNARVVVNHYLEKGRWWIWGLSALALIVAAAVIRLWVEIKVFGTVLISQEQYYRFYGVAFGIFLLVVLLSTVYQLLENRHRAELQAREWEARHAEAQLSNLKAHINPHFLFNTLHNIYAAANLQLPHTADMVLKLSQLLRYVTYEAQTDVLPLDTEWTQVERYVELYKMRAEEQLNVEMERQDQGAQWAIAPMLLLPLVENAFKHGDLGQSEDAFVHIKLETDDSQLRFFVYNSFDPKDTQRDEVGGVGLENIRQRLQLIYPGQHQLSIQDGGSVFEARLIITANLIEHPHETDPMPVG